MNDTNFQVSLSYIDWAIEFDSKGFKLEDSGILNDGDTEYIMAANDETGVVISIYIEKEKKENYTSFDYRDFFIKKMGANTFRDFLTREHGEMAISEYMSPKMEDIDLKQKHLNALMVKGHFWIDIHLSKVNFEDDDMKLFHSVLDSINFVEKEISLPMKAFMQGNLHFSKKNYEEAIKYYTTCLEMEMENQTLQGFGIIMILDNLGMAYGISGNLKMAKETLELGLSIYPEFPMFHYNLACTHAEMDDLNGTISYLKNCYKYRDNMLHGETLPDPRTDDSFERFLSSKKFQKVIKKFPL